MSAMVPREWTAVVMGVARQHEPAGRFADPVGIVGGGVVG